MFVRVVDYVANRGGGIRFTTEVMRALTTREDLKLELVSYGPALERYRDGLAALNVSIRELEPGWSWRRRTPKRFLGIPGTGRLAMRLHVDRWPFEVPKAAFQDCDVVWLPWFHRHRLPRGFSRKVVASFHDTIMLEFPGTSPEPLRLAEEELTIEHLDSDATTIVSSNSTAAALSRLFAISSERVEVVRFSGDHSKAPEIGEIPPQWAWSARPYILCPTNCMPHKNIDGLLRGLASWMHRIPVVMTGAFTDLRAGVHPHEKTLRSLALSLNLSLEDEAIGLDYLSDPIYYALLSRAWAMVIPTLAEGGGFPIFEALCRGIPTVASDIPVLREQAAFLGAELIWFNPRDPQSLADSFEDLTQNYAQHKARALDQVSRLRRRSWMDVAQDYLRVFESVGRAETSRPSDDLQIKGARI